MTLSAAKIILSLLSGVLLAWSQPGFMSFLLGLIAMVPLLTAMDGATLKRSVLYATIAGLTTGLICHWWTIESSYTYSGGQHIQSLLAYIGLTLYHAMWFTLFAAAVHFSVRAGKNASWKWILLFSASAVCIEWLMMNIFPSFPWIILLANTQTDNLFLIQWASIGGLWSLSMIVAASNAAMFIAWKKKSRSFAIGTVSVIILLHAGGFILLNRELGSAGQPVKTVLLQENIDAESRWDDTMVDSLAHTFIALNRKAAVLHPRLIVWTETAIPWVMLPDDDLLNAAMNITYPTGASHLVGTLTETGEEGIVFNSMMWIEPDGKISARYDKRQLLAFLEKEVVSWKLPFVQSRYTNVRSGTREYRLRADIGNFGVMICNESLSPYAAAEAANDGAEFLIVSANSSWFAGSFLVRTHLGMTRMRAVETGKDLVFNANQGFAGVIRSTGRMELNNPESVPRIVPLSVRKNNAVTFAARFPDGLLYCSLLINAIMVFQYFIHTNLQRRSK